MTSPTPTTNTPSPPQQSPLSPPKPLNAIYPPSPPQTLSNLTTPTTTTATVKKPQPIPWTHQETVHLIQAYQEKWYSLKRGQLKASQWEEVAVTVAVRCGYDHHYPSKSSTQCRHKIEKLRKRYRNERQRVADGGVCTWHYFDLMDRLERGPMPISARPVSMVPFGAKSEGEFGQRVVRMDEDFDDDGNYDTINSISNNNNNGNMNGGEDDDDDDEEDEEDEDKYSRSRSINYILRRPAVVNRFPGDKRYSIGGGGGGGGRGSGYMGIEKEEGIEEEEEEGEDDEEEERSRSRRRKVVSELAAEIRGFAERYVGMEKAKMEMMRETERYRMEMENKRMDMMIDAQRKFVDTIAMAFASTSASNNKKIKFSNS